jgi:hypothetical protein
MFKYMLILLMRNTIKIIMHCGIFKTHKQRREDTKYGMMCFFSPAPPPLAGGQGEGA